MPDQKELVGRIAFAKQILAGLEQMVARAAGDELHLFDGGAGKERMLLQDLLKILHAVFFMPSSGCGCGFALMAAASSVMSMPTGHQVMQRPQPTQPDVPN